MLDVATFFYKHLLGFEGRRDIHLGPNFWNPDELVTDVRIFFCKNIYLKTVFKILLWSLVPMVHGAPGPDGLSFLFYQTFWELIKNDFMWMVKDYENGNLDVSRLNFAIITLIPKVSNAKDLKNFRPISLGNCSVKIFFQSHEH